jgi:hypothetical protein
MSGSGARNSPNCAPSLKKAWFSMAPCSMPVEPPAMSPRSAAPWPQARHPPGPIIRHQSDMGALRLRHSRHRASGHVASIRRPMGLKRVTRQVRSFAMVGHRRASSRLGGRGMVARLERRKAVARQRRTALSPMSLSNDDDWSALFSNMLHETPARYQYCPRKRLKTLRHTVTLSII